MNIEKRCELIQTALTDKFGPGQRTRFFRAPGRVDLLGSHTDYNEGYILACAVDRDIIAGARANDRGMLRMYSLNTELEVQVNIDELVMDKMHGWANYPKGVVGELIDRGLPVKGLDLVVHGTVPVGGNLSSSAALEAVTCEAALAVSEISMPLWERIQICKRAENVFMGMPCGIMDQFTVYMGQKDAAVWLDCRTLEFEVVPLLPDKATLVVIDSGVGRELVASEYAKRVEECRQAVGYFKGYNRTIKSLRDVTMDDMENLGGDMDELILRRARHVVSENDRVLRARQALTEGDIEGLGKIFDQGFLSCRDDYECSARELNVIHELASNIEGVLGTRIAGAGWGGCMVSLVEKDAIGEFSDKLPKEYKDRTGNTAKVWTVAPGPGPSEIEELSG